MIYMYIYTTPYVQNIEQRQIEQYFKGNAQNNLSEFEFHYSSIFHDPDFIILFIDCNYLLIAVYYNIYRECDHNSINLDSPL